MVVGVGGRATPLSRDNGQKAAPGYVLAHCSTRAMRCHEMAAKEGVLSLEQNLISLAPYSLL